MGAEKNLFVKLRNTLAGSKAGIQEEKQLKQRIQECKDEQERKVLKRKYKNLRKIRERKEQRAGILLGTAALAVVAAGTTAGVMHVLRVREERIAAEEQAAREEEERIAREKKAEEERIARENAPVEIVLSFTGDCTLGTDEAFDIDNSFNSYFEYYGKDYFFQNVRPLFEKDDITVVNMEGTLTDSPYREEKEYAFKGRKEFVGVLTSGSVEAANLANNHSHDYGDQSYQDTVDTLEEAGIAAFGYDDVAIIELKEKKGIKVGFLGIYELRDHLERKPQVKSNIEKLKAQGADLIVAVFHWSNELQKTPDEYQVELGHYAIDEGADLVIGHHPHVVQGVEEYKGKTIAYSLGNFCFGGNQNPTDKDALILQETFTMVKGELTDRKTTLIPCMVSSEYYTNNYQPMIFEDDEAERVLQKIRERL